MPTKIQNPEFALGGREEWVDDAGFRLVGVHPENEGCRKHGCALHNPSDHAYTDYPLIWSPERAMFVRRINDLKTVLDPDEQNFRKRMASAGIEGPLYEGAENAL